MKAGSGPWAAPGPRTSLKKIPRRKPHLKNQKNDGHTSLLLITHIRCLFNLQDIHTEPFIPTLTIKKLSACSAPGSIEATARFHPPCFPSARLSVFFLLSCQKDRIPALFTRVVRVSSFSLLILFGHYVLSDSLQSQGLHPARLPCPSPSPRVCSNSCPLSRWCYWIISSSTTPFSLGLQCFPASWFFPMTWIFASGGQNIIKASASVLPVNIQGWYPLGWTGLTSLQSQGLSRIFSRNTIRKH